MPGISLLHDEVGGAGVGRHMSMIDGCLVQDYGQVYFTG